MSFSATKLQQAAKNALAVQDACNLSGVARSFIEAIDTIRATAVCQGTQILNTHPVVTLFLMKLLSLNGSDCFCSECTAAYSRAVKACEEIVTSEEAR